MLSDVESDMECTAFRSRFFFFNEWLKKLEIEKPVPEAQIAPTA